MTQADIVAAISEKSGLPKTDVSKFLEALSETIIATLKNEGSFRLHPLGVFEVKKMPKRTGRNPRTGETIQIAASNTVKFRTGTALKGAVN